jgi:CBS domain-containing protein
VAPRVKFLMSAPIVSVEPSTSALEAAKLMREKGIGALLVKRGDEVAGIVTERDLVYKVLAEGKDPAKVKVEEVMTPAPLQTIDVDATVEEAAALMTKKRVRRLIVVDSNGKPAGIITATDIVLHAA